MSTLRSPKATLACGGRKGSCAALVCNVGQRLPGWDWVLVKMDGLLQASSEGWDLGEISLVLMNESSGGCKHSIWAEMGPLLNVSRIPGTKVVHLHI